MFGVGKASFHDITWAPQVAEVLIRMAVAIDVLKEGATGLLELRSGFAFESRDAPIGSKRSFLYQLWDC